MWLQIRSYRVYTGRQSRRAGVAETVRVFGGPWNTLQYNVLRESHNVFFLKHQYGWNLLGEPTGELAGQWSWASCKRMVIKMGWNLSWRKSPVALLLYKSLLGLIYYECDTGGQVFSSSFFSDPTKVLVICIVMLLLFICIPPLSSSRNDLLLCVAGKQMHKEHSTWQAAFKSYSPPSSSAVCGLDRTFASLALFCSNRRTLCVVPLW